jgi:hypothetical protein
VFIATRSSIALDCAFRTARSTTAALELAVVGDDDFRTGDAYRECA